MRLIKASTQDVLPYAAVLVSASLSPRIGPLLTCLVAAALCFLLRTVAAFRQLGISKRPRIHTFVLHTVRLSHFSEKVRWALQKAGATFTEEADVAILGVLLMGRAVPRLRVQPPNAPPYTVVGSANCISALHAALMQDGADPASIAWLQYNKGDSRTEYSIDKLGLCMQKILYSDLLRADLPQSQQEANSAILKRAWGLEDTSVPPWQRWLAVGLFPVLKGFVRKTFPPSARSAAVDSAHTILRDLDGSAAAALGASQYLGGASPNRLDIALASISYIWALDTPERRALFSAGRDHGVVSNAAEVPAQAELSASMAKAAPAVHKLCVRMYEQHRICAAP